MSHCAGAATDEFGLSSCFLRSPIRRSAFELLEKVLNIHQSLEQILRSKDAFGKSFYQVFFEQYPHVREHFDGVNMRRQAVLLTMALIVIERYYYEPFQATEQYLQYLGTRHKEWEIPRELYSQWADAMLTSLASFHGDQWSDDLGRQWQEAIGRATELLFEGYDERFRL